MRKDCSKRENLAFEPSSMPPSFQCEHTLWHLWPGGNTVTGSSQSSTDADVILLNLQTLDTLNKLLLN